MFFFSSTFLINCDQRRSSNNICGLQWPLTPKGLVLGSVGSSFPFVVSHLQPVTCRFQENYFSLEIEYHLGALVKIVGECEEGWTSWCRNHKKGRRLVSFKLSNNKMQQKKTVCVQFSSQLGSMNVFDNKTIINYFFFSHFQESKRFRGAATSRQRGRWPVQRTVSHSPGEVSFICYT
jgi:hypothetical protein